MNRGSEYLGWAVVLPSGQVVVDVNPGASEDDLWRIALGWPTRGEVRQAKEQGGRAIPCRIVEALDE